jgi:hypothetical protein
MITMGRPSVALAADQSGPSLMVRGYCFGGQICFSGTCISGFSHCKSTESKKRGSCRQRVNCSRSFVGDSRPHERCA